MTFTVDVSGVALAGFLRGKVPGTPWSEVKRWIGGSKVTVDGKVVEDEGARLLAGQVVEVRMAAPRRVGVAVRIVFEDAAVVIIDKPAGVSSVPYDEKETGTAMDLVREAWRRMGRPATSTPLHVVHRIDKETSGLLCFAKTKRAEIAIAAQLRAHTVERLYLCVCNGDVRAARIESELVTDRGDGLRGSARWKGQGKRAVTHVEPVERLRDATLCRVQLETGKTHQIRIHLAERGHPLVGEKVYSRDATNQGRELIASPRLLLHAATLGFVHPTTEGKIALEAPLPEDFTSVLERLRRS